MTCKNCGAKLRDNAKVCTNCGAFIDDASGYTLLASDDRVYDVYSKEKKPKNNALRLVIAVLVFSLIAGAAAYLYFGKIEPKRNAAPELKFSQGSGLINRKEEVVYVSIPKGADIQYIHGVSLYDYDRTLYDMRDAISTDYEYTKNIDTTFRAIFFNMKDFNVEKGVKHTYTFEMKFSFNGSDKIYTYLQPVEINGKFENDVSDFVFDHSLTKGDKKDSKKVSKKKTDNDNYDFIYSGYWYTKPDTTDNIRSISAFKFNKDKTYTVTNYTKRGATDWQVEADGGKFSIKNGELILEEGGSFELDSEKEEIKESQDGKTTQKLTKRKYNSVQNSEDFFGI